MQVVKTLHATKTRRRPRKRGLKLNLHERRNLSVQFEEFAMRITPTVSDLQSCEQRRRILREKSENSRKVVSREIMCSKIMKLVYNNSIYTKTF